MKMQPDRLEGTNLISRLEGSRLWVHQTGFEGSVLVPHRGPVQAWGPQRFEDLTSDHFGAALAFKPELVIVGTGSRLRFPAPALWRALMDAGVGFEAMDTGAACRTFNVLASEGRAVLAALILA
ncbi:MAG: Mth938-like domain-containing protein [Burkholderiales bacterium]|jgi:uncharacterized protein|nr:Mth938-like domain-containing protein [Burkholderiales bacterium]NBO75565.1 hypothetical protein [Betaproteobacteria bacterium]